MSHAEELVSVRSEQARLRERCEELSEKLASASRDLKNGGVLPDVALIDDLDSLRSQFADLRRSTLQLAAAVDGPSSASAHEVTSVSALEALAAATEAALERRAAERAKRLALATLESVERVRHRDSPAFEPLDQCHVLAGSLRRELENLESPISHPDLSRLVEGQHPLAYLVAFVRDQSDLDDSRWEFLHDALSQAFGRPLAVAAARGKLWIPHDERPPGAEAMPPSFGPVADASEDEWPTATLAWPASDPSEPQLATLQPAVHTDHSAVADPDTLVWEGLLRGRVSAAFLVASHSASSTSVPAWVLRALALSSRLLHVNGDIALQLTDDFARWDARDLGPAGDGGGDVPRALWLLVLASAVRPALVAPDCGAWTILKARPENADLPELERYARVMGAYGERHPPLAPHTLGPSLPPAAWRDTLEDLLREIGAWRVRFLGMRSAFPPVNEVWRHWLRPDGPIHALLAPLTLDDHGLEAARGLVERLSNTVQIQWEIAETDRRLLGRARGPDIASRPVDADQLVERMREAVAFARRWIALQERRPSRPDDEPRRRALALREQLLPLRPAVEQELASLSESEAGLPVRAAVAACRAALASVDALLGAELASDTPAWWMQAREPLLRQALHADLLHVPGLHLDRAWSLARVEPERVLRGTGTLILADAWPDWQATFAIHLRNQDYLATAQVIECVELGDPALAARLEAVRTDELAGARWSLRSELELTRDQLDVATAQGHLDDGERARLLFTVEGIALALPSLLRFQHQRKHLRLIRDQVEARQRDSSGAAAVSEEPDGQLREREREQLLAANGPSLVAARPGMGTSSLLEAAAEAYRASGEQHLALLIDMNVAQDQSTLPPAEDGRHVERFWGLLAEDLAPVIGSREHTLGPDALARAVQAWLEADQSRGLLLLVDHADAMLEDEVRVALLEMEGDLYPTSTRLAQLMHSSNGSLKVVLAGASTVLRAAGLRDYPLASRGCVHLRALLDHGGWRDAAVLLRQNLEPARAESANVSARALAVANYEPGTIERLGHLLAARAAGSSVSVSLLESVVSSREGAQILTASITGLLQRDPRYAVVVYCLALAARAEDADSAEGESAPEGVTSGWLREQAGLWWPQGFAQTWSDDTFDGLLEELVGLSLVRRLAPDCFAFGNPNAIACLGTQEELIARLFEYAGLAFDEPEGGYEYLPGSSRPPLAGGPAGRSPLTERQLSRLLGPTHGCTVVFGTQAAGVEHVARALDALAGPTRVVSFESFPQPQDRAAFVARIEEVTAREAADARLTLVVPHTWVWTREWLERIAADQPATCRVIFVADPATTWRIMEQHGEAHQSLAAWLAERGVGRVSLTAWQPGLVRLWATEPDERGAQTDALEEMTGGWPLLVERGLGGGAAGQWASAFGLDLPPARVLQPLVVLGQANAATLLELADAPDRAIVSRSLEWARLLHIARPVDASEWRLDPVVSNVLRVASRSPL